MSEVTEQEIQLSKELNDLGEDLKGVREVQSVYGQMASKDYQVFVLVNVDNIDYLEEQIQVLKTKLKSNEDGKNQFVMMVNNASENRLVFMAENMKNAVFDDLKTHTLPRLDDSLEAAFDAKKAELDAAANGN